MNELKIKRVLILFFLFTSFIFFLQGYINYNKSQELEIKITSTQNLLDKKDKECWELKEKLDEFKFCNDRALLILNEHSRFIGQRFEIKDEFNQIFYRWLALEAFLVFLFFGNRYVNTGSLKKEKN